MRSSLLLVAAVVGGASGLSNGLVLKPPLGWNTWVSCDDTTCGHDVCSEKMVKEVAEAMIENGMQALGYSHVNLDDCWAYPRDNTTGKLTWDVSRFPSGIPALISWLHERNFTFGLYTSAGNQTCSNGGRSVRIPGSRGHYELDAKTFAEWDVDFVKFDWCGDIKKHVLDGAQAHRDWAKAMNESGKAMVVDVVAGFFFLGDDISKYANSWRFCEDHHDAWSSLKEQIFCRADQTTLGVEGSPGGWANLDFLMTGGAGCTTPGSHCPGMTDDEYKTEFVVWSLLQSPLIVATDVRNMTSVMKQALLNQELLEIHQSTETPPGRHLARWLCSEPLDCNVWGRKLKPDNSEWLVAFVNTGSEAHDISVGFDTLGWKDKSSTASVRDLWIHADLEQATGRYTAAKIPSHGTHVIKLTLQAQ